MLAPQIRTSKSARHPGTTTIRCVGHNSCREMPTQMSGKCLSSQSSQMRILHVWKTEQWRKTGQTNHCCWRTRRNSVSQQTAPRSTSFCQSLCLFHMRKKVQRTRNQQLKAKCKTARKRQVLWQRMHVCGRRIMSH